MDTVKSRPVTYQDHPIPEVLANIEAKIKEGWICFVKFTCEKCGSRQTSDTPNSYAALGYTCEECGHLTQPKGINFMAVKATKGEDLAETLSQIKA